MHHRKRKRSFAILPRQLCANYCALNGLWWCGKLTIFGITTQPHFRRSFSILDQDCGWAVQHDLKLWPFDYAPQIEWIVKLIASLSVQRNGLVGCGLMITKHFSHLRKIRSILLHLNRIIIAAPKEEKTWNIFPTNQKPICWGLRVKCVNSEKTTWEIRRKHSVIRFQFMLMNFVGFVSVASRSIT